MVARILRAMGYQVFDCDSEAKALMDTDETIKQRLAEEIASDVIDRHGAIDRQRLAEIVFADKAKLALLNSIVHAAVRLRITRWASEMQSSVVFVETAILRESGLDAMVDAEWRIEAPEPLRVQRVHKRNGLSREQIIARIEAQSRPCQGSRHTDLPLVHIVNDDTTPLLPQILHALHT